MATSTAVKVCACGCGRALPARRSTRCYFSDACRMRRNRASAPHQSDAVPAPVKRERRTQGQVAVGTPDVRVTDREPVYCAGCYAVLPKIYRPLPVPAYCRDCVAAGRCDCFNRPARHRRGK